MQSPSSLGDYLGLNCASLGARLGRGGGSLGWKAPVSRVMVSLTAWSQREKLEWAFVCNRWGCVFPGLIGRKQWREEMTAGMKGGPKTCQTCPPSSLARQQIAFISDPLGQEAACSE